MDEFDVVIVGGGPVGLFLACELGLARCSVLVLEREEPGSPWRAEPLGMRGLSAASAEAFYRRGMLPALVKASGVRDYPGVDPDADEPSPPRIAGHFAGLLADPAKIDPVALPFRLPSPASEFMMTSLAAVEAVLSDRAAELGVEIRRGAAVSAMTQDEDRVVVQAAGHEYGGRWVVGCDGGRSAVRRLAGFEFVGTEPQFTGYVALATIADPEKLSPGMINLTPTGAYLQMSSAGHIGMMDFDGGAFDRSQSLSREHLQEVLRRVSGTDVTLSEVDLASSFTDRAKQTTTYRQGRVLLAGDAAHIHSPLGGQGLNLGIGDAMNLGWKLAATVRGYAPEGLLDTYTRERHPIGAQVLERSRAQVEIMRPDPHARAVRAMIRDLLDTRDGATYLFGAVSGASIRYDVGSEHPLAGSSAPDLRLVDGTRLGELTRDGRGVAMDFSANELLRASMSHWENRIRYVAGPARNDLGLSAVLVRPDGMVAWATDLTPDPEEFERAATRWFGNPVG
ncbi:FAD-dependent monooxygenase [Nocardia terpenica]|uniref:FAD-dependent oxidoreductase n=1 Tax=Nocardia terpenica TaxID=455432 RepID=A0A291RLU9_9NOCA|nr:FAD-dependent monooxygenase [Nocardia terpenica]ATL68260.1 FAD-dependent oxidoreductase [Nocardia terpenica]